MKNLAFFREIKVKEVAITYKGGGLGFHVTKIQRRLGLLTISVPSKTSENSSLNTIWINNIKTTKTQCW